MTTCACLEGKCQCKRVYIVYVNEIGDVHVGLCTHVVVHVEVCTQLDMVTHDYGYICANVDTH